MKKSIILILVLLLLSFGCLGNDPKLAIYSASINSCQNGNFSNCHSLSSMSLKERLLGPEPYLHVILVNEGNSYIDADNISFGIIGNIFKENDWKKYHFRNVAWYVDPQTNEHKKFTKRFIENKNDTVQIYLDLSSLKEELFLVGASNKPSLNLRVYYNGEPLYALDRKVSAENLYTN